MIFELLTKLKTMTPAECAEYDAEIERREMEAKSREKIRRFTKSGAPERYWPESLDTYRVTNEMQATAVKATAGFVQSVMRGEFRSLVLLGNAGTGKTHLACAIVREVGGQYRMSPDIVEELRRAKSFTAPQTEAEILDYYSRVKLLVIDEIGRGISAPDEKYMIYQILNARYNTRKATVFISNYSKADFLQYIGVAAADRLVESAEICELHGESYRKELRGCND